MKNNFLYNLSVVIMKQGRRYVAYSPALDLSTSGTSEKDAKKKFAEAAEIFFEELAEEGLVSAALKELGWGRAQGAWNPPYMVSGGSVDVRVPQAA